MDISVLSMLFSMHIVTKERHTFGLIGTCRLSTSQETGLRLDVSAHAHVQSDTHKATYTVQLEQTTLPCTDPTWDYRVFLVGPVVAAVGNESMCVVLYLENFE